MVPIDSHSPNHIEGAQWLVYETDRKKPEYSINFQPKTRGKHSETVVTILVVVFFLLFSVHLIFIISHRQCSPVKMCVVYMQGAEFYHLLLLLSSFLFCCATRFQ